LGPEPEEIFSSFTSVSADATASHWVTSLFGSVHG